MERIALLNSHFIEPNETAAPVFQEYYDYIVVGAGSAGCVVAARLSEDPKVTVLLIEAGPEDDQFTINTPVTYGDLQLTDLDWQFQTEKQPFQNNRVSKWPRGKVMGGSSSINAMLYVRGDKDNYDSWERDGCTGWGFKDLLPYFKRSETCQVEGADPEYRGKSGDWVITSPPPNEFAHYWVKAGVQAGLPFNKDYNGASMHGISYSQVNISKGIRQNTSRAFLGPHRKTRKNLTVLTSTHVTKVIFQGTTAVGVQFKRGSTNIVELRKKKTEVVFCNKEVILSGGAVNSPWLLLASGVGPKNELEALGIPVVADLPVGKNLQDHLMLFHIFQTKNGSPLPGKSNHLQTIKILTEYLLFKTGIAAHTVLQGTAFLTTGLRGDNSPAPDLQIHFVPAAPISSTATQANLDKDPYWKEPEKTVSAEAVVFLPTLLKPKSVGEIRLKSKDPLDYPLIQPNYFSDPEGYDLKLMIEGMKTVRKMAKQPALASKLRGEVIDTSIPYPPESDEYLAAFLKKSAITVYHPVGTCKMGALSDPTAVVDPTLKVKGIKGLRVVDCSIMPNIVSANTNAPAVVIGEKGADLIKTDLKK